MAIRVVLGEDNVASRHAIMRLFAEMGQVEVVATGDDLPTLRAAVRLADADLVVTDLRMPPTHTDEGLRLATEMRTSAPAVGVLLISGSIDLVNPVALFEHGTAGRGYMAKEQLRDLDEFRKAMQAVASGDSYVHHSLLQQLDLNPSKALSRLEQLTRDERAQLARLAASASPDVGDDLSGLYEKLGVLDARVDPPIAASLIWAARPR